MECFMCVQCSVLVEDDMYKLINQVIVLEVSIEMRMPFGGHSE